MEKSTGAARHATHSEVFHHQDMEWSGQVHMILKACYTGLGTNEEVLKENFQSWSKRRNLR